MPYASFNAKPAHQYDQRHQAPTGADISCHISVYDIPYPVIGQATAHVLRLPTSLETKTKQSCEVCITAHVLARQVHECHMYVAACFCDVQHATTACPRSAKPSKPAVLVVCTVG